jgi:DNA repair protein RadC
MSGIPYFITTYADENPGRMFMVPEYRLAVVREGTLKVRTKAVSNPFSVYEFMKPITGDLDREVVFGIYLDQKNKIIGINEISVGSLTEALVHPREVLKPAIIVNSAAMIVMHNHPSGDPAPSRADMALMKRIALATSVIGIRMIDFMVAGQDSYYSAAESGALPVISDHSELDRFFGYSHETEYQTSLAAEQGS